MPDIANRPELEERLTHALMQAREPLKARLVGYLGIPPDVRRVPPAFWDELQADEQKVLASIIVIVFALSGGNLSRRLGAVDQRRLDLLNSRSQLFAAQRAAQVARESADNARERLRSALAGAGTDGGRVWTPEDVGVVLDDVWSEENARRVGVTEVTRGVSAGEDEVANDVRSQGGTAVARWICELDSRTCPICRPLHRMRERFWRDRFPDGPPSHPACRCFLQWEMKTV